MLLRDGKTLCFASVREGGYGSYDIWCSEQDADGSWQEPVNQGPNINTAGSEFHFMEDKDAKWVYFTSTRPGGQGAADIWAVAQPRQEPVGTRGEHFRDEHHRHGHVPRARAGREDLLLVRIEAREHAGDVGYLLDGPERDRSGAAEVACFRKA